MYTLALDAALPIFATEECGPGLRLAGGRGAADPDRPYRLVGHHSPLQRGVAGQFEDGIELAGEHVFGLPGLALLQGLAHAQDRHQPGGLGGHELACHQLAALVVVLAPPGMADQALLLAHAGSPRPGDLAGVGALPLPTPT